VGEVGGKGGERQCNAHAAANASKQLRARAFDCCCSSLCIHGTAYLLKHLGKQTTDLLFCWRGSLRHWGVQVCAPKV